MNHHTFLKRYFFTPMRYFFIGNQRISIPFIIQSIDHTARFIQSIPPSTE